jgi:hypothetical protein
MRLEFRLARRAEQAEGGVNPGAHRATWSDVERLSLKDATVRSFITTHRADELSELQILRAMVLRLVEEKHNLAHALIEAKAREAPRYMLDAE